MRIIFIALTILGFCGASFGQTPAASEEANTQQNIREVNYLCERNVELPVVFINQPDGQSSAVALIEGKLITMRQGISASGARYIAIDEQMSYRLHIKGNEAVLSFMEADHEATEQILLKACDSYEGEEN